MKIHFNNIANVQSFMSNINIPRSLSDLDKKTGIIAAVIIGALTLAFAAVFFYRRYQSNKISAQSTNNQDTTSKTVANDKTTTMTKDENTTIPPANLEQILYLGFPEQIQKSSLSPEKLKEMEAKFEELRKDKEKQKSLGNERENILYLDEFAFNHCNLPIPDKYASAAFFRHLVLNKMIHGYASKPYTYLTIIYLTQDSLKKEAGKDATINNDVIIFDYKKLMEVDTRLQEIEKKFPKENQFPKENNEFIERLEGEIRKSYFARITEEKTQNDALSMPKDYVESGDTKAILDWFVQNGVIHAWSNHSNNKQPIIKLEEYDRYSNPLGLALRPEGWRDRSVIESESAFYEKNKLDKEATLSIVFDESKNEFPTLGQKRILFELIDGSNNRGKHGPFKWLEKEHDPASLLEKLKSRGVIFDYKLESFGNYIVYVTEADKVDLQKPHFIDENGNAKMIPQDVLDVIHS